MTDLSVTIETDFPPEEIAPVVSSIINALGE
jgi:hypothetical protein